jgi:hypothetical protein
MRDELSQLGWMMQGMAPDGFAVRLDPAERRDGHPALTLVPVGAQEGQYGTWVRVVSAREYAGHRIRVSGFTKTDGATARAELWARVQAKDSAGDGAGLGGHWEHLPAASEWTRREIVLEVPEEASVINYGVGRTGPGRLWFDALALEIVGDDVPVSGHETDRVVGEWTVSGLGTGTGRARLEGAELHITLPSYAEPPLSVVRRIALEPKVGGTATVTIDVQTRELNMKPTCSVRTLRARYASESLETASKALPPTSDGFVKCELSLEIGPTARWVELGLGGLHGRGEIALREGTVEMKR